MFVISPKKQSKKPRVDKKLRSCFVYLKDVLRTSLVKKDFNTRMTTEAVFKFMQTQNRPFGANDVVSALEKEKHGKAAIQKALDRLADTGKIIIKTYGKHKVYCVKQESNQARDDIIRIEQELHAHALEQQKKILELQKELQEQEKTLNELKSSMTLEEAIQEEARLKQLCAKLSQKLDEVMEVSGSEDLCEKKKEAEKSLNLYSKECAKRKKICNDILECILESYPGSKKELYNDIGIEIVTDK